MARVNAHIHAFNVGEISKAGLARIDQARTRLAAEIQENILPSVVGKAQFRPGFEYIGATPSNAESRQIPFAKSASDTALLIASNAELRIVIDDEYLTRASVTSSVTNGDFASGTGWTLTVTGGATANINSTHAGALFMVCPARGGTATCERSVTTSNAGTEHALRIIVSIGTVAFRCGSTSGDDDYVSETELGVGTHSLTFTPAGTYYVNFSTRKDIRCVVDSIQVESAGVVVLPAPWTTAQLFEIRYAQSLDELFVVHTAWMPRRIQRNNNARSWSIIEYRANDGPFMLAAYRDVKLTASEQVGNTTLSSDVPFFKPEHVGCLFRLFHEQTNITVSLGALGEHTEAIRVNGIGTDNDFAFAITGTWVGTINIQRSYTSEDEAFVNVSSGTHYTHTVNAANTYTPGTSLDNVVHWYRYAFTAYTSGSAAISIGYTGDARYGVCRVIGYLSSTSVFVEVLRPFGNFTSTKRWLEGAWSDRAGWPSAVAIIDGRLAFGRDDKFWLSESDNYYAFGLDTEGEKGSIQRAIATGQGASTTRWIMPLDHMLIGTTDQVAAVRSSALNEQLAPTSTTVKDVSTIRCSAVNPIRVDSRGIVIDESGRRVYELVQGQVTGSYEANEITALNEDIAGTSSQQLTGLAVQRHPQTYVWHKRSDGQCPVLLYEPKQEVAAYVRLISDGADGEIEDICMLPDASQDRAYVIVKRTINSSTVRYIEKLALPSEARGSTWNKMADSFVTAAGPVSSVTAAHLANQTGLVGWGYLSGVGTALTGLSANGSGVIALGATYTNVCVGLPYGWRYKSAKLAYGARGGTALLQTKKVNAMGVLLIDTHKDAIEYGADFDHMYPMPQIERGTTISEATHDTYDEPVFPMDGTWDTDSRVCMQGQAPYHCTLSALVVNVETNESV